MAFNKKKRSKMNGKAEERIPTQNPSAIQPAQKAEPEFLLSSVSVQEKIELLAYSFWEQRGRPGGSPDEDWFRAEMEILGPLNIAE
jgi:hypothetical protein